MAGDVLLAWNQVALEANRRDHTGAMNGVNQRGPTRSSRALAIVHLAIHDAYFGLVGADATENPLNIGPYLPSPPLPAPPALPGVGANRDEAIRAAISFAAYTTLVRLYPAFLDFFNLAICLEGFTSQPDPGRGSFQFEQFGVAVGQAILDERASDDLDSMRNVPPPINPATNEMRRENHRGDPTEPPQPLLGEGWGYLRHFSVSGCLNLDPHPPVGSAEYENDYKLVYVKGSFLPPVRKFGHADRTPDETLVGLYWAYDGPAEIGTPPRLYNQIVQNISVSRGRPGGANPSKLELWENVRLFALVNVAMADAGILAWYYKYCYYLWRPILGVREHDPSLGPITTAKLRIDDEADPFWTPLGSPRTNEVGPSVKSFTPPFPAYPSGHATFGAAAFEIVRRFYGFGENEEDNISFEFVSDELNGVSREANGGRRTRHLRRYRTLLDAMYDNSVSRIYLGVHWRFDGVASNIRKGRHIVTKANSIGGVPLGRDIANDIFGGGIQNGLGKNNNQCALIGGDSDTRCPARTIVTS